MALTWVLNGSSKYEISSKDHLLQLMNQGSLFTDSGSSPTDYWDGDYEQTVDIDLAADANIGPIGINGDNFSGSYDGGNFSISNWSYDGATAGATQVGLFGSVGGATLENIKLRGVWVASATHSLGFLVGYNSSGTLRNIDCIFDEGSTLSDATQDYGAIAGECSYATTYAVSVGGIINTVNISPNADGGGVAGSLSGTNHVGLRNAAVWPNGLTGDHVGGLVGILNNDANLTYCVNAMVGDITGDKCGGIIGYTSRGGGTDPFSQMVNSMKGNITGTTYAGGIAGESYGNYGSFGPSDVMNYMTGNIVSTNNTSGGIVGYASKRTSSYTLSISNAVNAMNGTVDDAAVGTTTIVTTVSMKIDTSFGLTYTTANYGSTSDTFTGTTSTLFPSLSYTPFVFTDNASNSYEYEMVFGNVGGNSSYSQYTHAIISKGDVAGPYFVDFDLTPDTTEYITYVSIDSYASVYTDGSLAVLDSSAVVVFDYAGSTVLFGGLPSALGITSVGAVDAAVSITPVPTAVSYQLRYVPTSGGTPVITTFTELTRVVNGLGPETEYEISLYYLPSGSSIYTLESSKTVTTLANIPASYDLSIYGSGGEYDLSGISDLGNLSEVMNDLFATGDELTINLNGSAEKVSLVKVGETVALPESSILFPFTSSNGAGQAVTLTLPDTTTQTVTYNDSSEEITVGGTTYADGDTFVLGGKKATVVNV